MAMKAGNRNLFAFLPVMFAAVWILLPFLLIQVAPIRIEIDNLFQTVSYVLVNVFALIVGYAIGVHGVWRWSNQKLPMRKKWFLPFFAAAAVISIGLLPMSVVVYTGQSLGDLGGSIDQSEAYASRAEALEFGDSVARQIVSLLRGLAAPITLAAIPLAIFFWKHLTKQEKLFALLVVACNLILSVFRGTNKEVGDIVLLVSAAGAARLVVEKFSIKRYKEANRGLPYAIGAAFLMITFLVIFVYRKSERYGGFVSFCVYLDAACFIATGTSEWADALGFGAAMLTAYIGQGYFGLSLALPIDAAWTWGIGHSAPLLTMASVLFDTNELYETGLMAQLRYVGWDDRYVWSSIFPVLASDLGFGGVPFFFLLVGYIYGKSWKSALLDGSSPAVVTFACLSILIVYTPANHQLAQSLDSYLGSFFWITLFLINQKYPNFRLRH